VSLTLKVVDDSVSSGAAAGAAFLKAGWFSRDHFSFTGGSADFLGTTAGTEEGFSSAIAASVREMTCSSSVFNS
jgi:hypothetical protein